MRDFEHPTLCYFCGLRFTTSNLVAFIGGVRPEKEIWTCKNCCTFHRAKMAESQLTDLREKLRVAEESKQRLEEFSQIVSELQKRHGHLKPTQQQPEAKGE